MTRRLATLLPLLAAVLLVSRCGGSPDEAAPPGASRSPVGRTSAAGSPTAPESGVPAASPRADATVPLGERGDVVAVTGRLSCIGANVFQPRAVPQPFSPLNADLAPEVLTVRSLGSEWRFAWETAVHRETGTRWFERNPAELGSYGEYLALDFGPLGAAPVLAVRFSFEPVASTTGTGVNFIRLPGGEELDTAETAGTAGRPQWRAVDFPGIVASEPRLLAGSLGFEIEGIVLEEGWGLRGIRAGSRLLTYPDAGFHECEGRLTSARVLSKDRDEFGRLGSRGGPAAAREWQIHFD